MDNNQLIEKALDVALKAHLGQTDKSGVAYILHPLRLMHRAGTTSEKVLSLLHDVVEDSDYTPAQLADLGFPPYLLEALDCLTKRENEHYDNFIRRIAQNQLATRVKVLDIEDNLNILRLQQVSASDVNRINKYLNARNKLLDLKF